MRVTRENDLQHLHRFGFKSNFASYWLCDLGQVTLILLRFSSLIYEIGIIIELPQKVLIRIK